MLTMANSREEAAQHLEVLLSLLYRSSGVHNQLREVTPKPFPRIRVSRTSNGVPEGSAKAPWVETQLDSQGSTPPVSQGKGVSSPPLPVHRDEPTHFVL